LFEKKGQSTLFNTIFLNFHLKKFFLFWHWTLHRLYCHRCWQRGSRRGGAWAPWISHMIPLMCFSPSSRFVKIFLLSPTIVIVWWAG